MPQPAYPSELLAAQRDWYATYAHLAAEPGPQTAALRRRLLQLSRQIAAHPYWRSPAGASPAARMQLKQAAWSLPR
ncbi:hypothetical protein G5C51_31675 [Streptomyces sp. A7024]|uniref:Uncharacterized protein n=1 Tax=Streptomyces coryli TaxID=1128680 RepID=A0A6G4U8C9_9ACTN|nr:hypothetical protein [Streptomyces coryli]NGN68444.1 hypothetical protein [Streptomyces coryli]